MQLPMADDVNLDPIAAITEGFSGADLQALLSDAQLAAVHEFLSKEDRTEPGTTPMITDPLLKSIASKTKPSVSEAEKQKLYDIYSQFLDSRKSVSIYSLHPSSSSLFIQTHELITNNTKKISSL